MISRDPAAINFFKDKLLGSRLPHQALEEGHIRAEWIDTRVPRRTDKVVLLLHGGVYVLGSPQMYRWLTFPMAVCCNAQVLGMPRF